MHGPEAIPQTSCIAHGARRSIPRFIDGVHIADPNVDEVVQSNIIKGHVIGTTIKLVFMESNKAPMVNQVVHQQPLLEDVAKVLLRVLQPKQGRVDDL